MKVYENPGLPQALGQFTGEGFKDRVDPENPTAFQREIQKAVTLDAGRYHCCVCGLPIMVKKLKGEYYCPCCFERQDRKDVEDAIELVR